ncbi:MAG: glutamate--tRNA ligase [Eubacteriales bacterium]
MNDINTKNTLTDGKVRTRFAPSPTGYMHVGNLRTALYTWLIARKGEGDFLLRIEDTDQGRLIEGATDVIYSTLAECSLLHDEGPDIGGDYGPYTQSERLGSYSQYADILIQNGSAYRCYCDKERLEKLRETDPTAGYDGHCAHLTPEEHKANEGKPFVVRQRIPKEGVTTFTDAIFGDITVENKALADQILVKADGMPTYNFANVVDDHLMAITHVVRGSEYLSSAPKYNLLYEAFGWNIPTYVHCSPVMRDAQNKMSKRHGDPSYEDLRDQGFLTAAILNYVALLGWSPKGEIAEKEFFTLEELVEHFDLTGLSKSPAIFDMDKLVHFNSLHLRAMTPEEFCATATPYITQTVKNYPPEAISSLLQARCEKLTDIPEKVDFFDTLPQYDKELYTHKKSKTDDVISTKMLTAAIEALQAIETWNETTIHETLISLATTLEVKNATLMWPVRIAIAGKTVTPGGAVEICHILGKEETLSRLAFGLQKLES